MEEFVVDEEVEQDKAGEVLGQIIDLLSQKKLRVQELVLLYGNLGYSIGASISGYTSENAPHMDELQKKYYEKPDIGTALMLQGLLTTTWQDDIAKSIKIEERK